MRRTRSRSGARARVQQLESDALERMLRFLRPRALPPGASPALRWLEPVHGVGYGFRPCAPTAVGGGELAHLDADATVAGQPDEEAGGVGVEPAVADRDVGQRRGCRSPWLTRRPV